MSRASDVEDEAEEDEAEESEADENDDASADGSEEEPEEEPPPVCNDTKIWLGGVVYMHDHVDRSVAMLRVPKTPRTGMYYRGMYVDGYLIAAVEPRGVLLEKDGEYCWLRLAPDPTRPKAPARPVKKKSKRSKRKKR